MILPAFTSSSAAIIHTFTSYEAKTCYRCDVGTDRNGPCLYLACFFACNILLRICNH